MGMEGDTAAISPSPSPSQPHVLLIAFPGQGHINPVLRLARRLAAKGLLVTFTSTSDVGRRLLPSSSSASSSSASSFPPNLRFDFLRDEPSGPLSHIDDLLGHLGSAGPSALSDLLRRQSAPVGCIVGNPFLPWVLDVAKEFAVPAAVLWVQSFAVFSAYYHYHHRLAAFPSDESDPPVSLPGLPPLSFSDVPSFLLPSNPYKLLADAILAQFAALPLARWVLVNSFDELEPDAAAALSAVSPVISVGPLIDPVRGDLLKAADDCLSWLDAQEARSVAYVSLGSVVVLTADEMAEMAWGLRDSGRPFLWVVRPESRDMLPASFLEDTKSGLVVGWSPQDQVLTHRSVGCFLTHCGWNSTLEALSAGLPVIAFPQWGDQVTDAKFLVDVYRVGVRLPAPVEREGLRRCVEAAMAGPEAEGMRERAAKWKAAAAAAVAEGGSSDRNIQKFVDELRRGDGDGDGDGTAEESVGQ